MGVTTVWLWLDGNFDLTREREEASERENEKKGSFDISFDKTRKTNLKTIKYITLKL